MFPELIAEFAGTLVLVLLGIGVVAMTTLFASGTPGEIAQAGYTNIGYTNITLGWGLAVTMGTYLAGRISGAHLNPAVSIALAIYRDFPWRKVAPYIAAQTLVLFWPRPWSIGIIFRLFRHSIPVSREQPESLPLFPPSRRTRSPACSTRPSAPPFS